MKKSRYPESQIFQILKEAEAGVPVPELSRKFGMSNASFYKWRYSCRAPEQSVGTGVPDSACFRIARI